MKRLGFMLALVGPTACSAAPAEADFGRDMLARLRVAQPAAQMSLDPDDPLAIVLHAPDKKNDGFFNVHRIFGYCQQTTAADCEAAKEEFVRNLSAPRPEPSLQSLRLIVRGKGYVDELARLNAEDPSNGSNAFHEHLGGDLYALLASDAPDTITVMSESQLKDLGVTRDQAWALAAKQTAAIVPPPPTAAQLATEAIGLEAEGYLASMLVDLEAWNRLAALAGPDLFVTVVSDQFVFVGIMPDGPKLNAFKRSVEEDCQAQQRCISPNLYRFRGGRWALAN